MMRRQERWILLLCCTMVVRCVGEEAFEPTHSRVEQGLTPDDLQNPPIHMDGGIPEEAKSAEDYEPPTINSEFFCDNPIYAADILAAAPYVITQPGEYCLVEDIDVGNLGGADATIVIDADDVTLDFWGHAMIIETEHGVQIEAWRSRITIFGGQVIGSPYLPFFPSSGVYSAGIPDQPISGVTIEDMVFYDLWHGVVMEHATSSLVTENDFVYCGNACLEWIGASQDSSVNGNFFDLPKYPTRVNNGVHAVCASELLIEGNMFYNSGLLTDIRYDGAPLYPGGRGVSIYCTPSEELEEGYDVVVIDNDFYRLQVGVEIMEGTEGTLIEGNTFYGGMPPVTRDPCTMDTGEGQAIWLLDAINVTIAFNRIFSGPDATWWAGINISGTSTIRGQGTKSPGIYGNETCRVDEPLLLPAGVTRSDVDGGNAFESCQPCM